MVFMPERIGVMIQAARNVLVFLAAFGLSGAAFGTVWNAPCPPSCATTPGGATHLQIDTEEAEYTCCNAAGACKVCDDCPWYLESWC
jgi:hypothetical protein